MGNGVNIAFTHMAANNQGSYLCSLSSSLECSLSQFYKFEGNSLEFSKFESNKVLID